MCGDRFAAAGFCRRFAGAPSLTRLLPRAGRPFFDRNRRLSPPFIDTVLALLSVYFEIKRDTRWCFGVKNKGVLVVAKDRDARAEKSGPRTLVSAVARQLFTAAAAALLSQVSVFSGLHPFGLALIIGAPDNCTVAALAGFVAGGYLFRLTVNTTAYTAAAGVVAALRWVLAGMSRGRRRRSSYLPGLVAGLLSVAVSEVSVMLLANGFSLRQFLTVAAGLAVCGAFSYFYRIVYEALRRGTIGLSAAQRASLALALCTVVMALYPLNIGPLSLGRLAGVFAVLYAAGSLSSPLDSGVFAAVSAGIVLSEPSFAFCAAGLAAAGALATLFKKRTRGVMCLVFIFSAALFAFCGGGYLYSMTYLAELTSASLLYLVLPAAAAPTFSDRGEAVQSMTSAMNQKLGSISSAMRDVGALLERTAQTRQTALDADRLFSSAAEKVCKSCKRMSACWVAGYGDTVDALGKLRAPLAERGSVCSADLPRHFRDSCLCPGRLCGAINSAYQAQRESENRGNNSRQYRAMLKNQMCAVSDMLDSACSELGSLKNWDEERSHRALECARRLGLSAETASCCYDEDDRPVFTVSLRDKPSQERMTRLRAGLGSIAGVKLSRPEVSETAKGVTLRFNMRPRFTVATAAAQSSAEGTVCGDVYSIFSDLAGNVHVLLSDGMGTGEEAARDGRLCCAFVRRLLEAGFAVKRAAELANSAMALREGGESAATLDVLSVNICDGTSRLLKAGAAPTYCLHRGETAKLESRSLPVGILDSVLCREVSLSLGDGDVVVITSDGAESDGAFIEPLLKKLGNESAETLCREISGRCFGRAGADDITVIVIKLRER